MLHLFTGLQSALVRIEKIMKNSDVVDSAIPGTDCVLTLLASKKIAYTQTDRFILANLDEKQRFVGYGFCHPGS
jgi:selenocysteine-specific elongation factor